MEIEAAIDKLEAEKAQTMKAWLQKREQQLKVNKTFAFSKWNALEQECLQLAAKFNNVSKQLEPLKQHMVNMKFLRQKEEQMDALLVRLRELENKKAVETPLSTAWNSYSSDIEQMQVDIAHLDQELQLFIRENNTECIINN